MEPGRRHRRGQPVAGRRCRTRPSPWRRSTASRWSRPTSAGSMSGPADGERWRSCWPRTPGGEGACPRGGFAQRRPVGAGPARCSPASPRRPTPTPPTACWRSRPSASARRRPWPGWPPTWASTRPTSRRSVTCPTTSRCCAGPASPTRWPAAIRRPSRPRRGLAPACEDDGVAQIVEVLLAARWASTASCDGLARLSSRWQPGTTARRPEVSEVLAGAVLGLVAARARLPPGPPAYPGGIWPGRPPGPPGPPEPGGSWCRMPSSCIRAAICWATSAVWMPWNRPSSQPTSWAWAIRSSASVGVSVPNGRVIRSSSSRSSGARPCSSSRDRRRWISTSRARPASSRGAPRTSSSSCLIMLPIRITLAGCSTCSTGLGSPAGLTAALRGPRRPVDPAPASVGAAHALRGHHDDPVVGRTCVLAHPAILPQKSVAHRSRARQAGRPGRARSDRRVCSPSDLPCPSGWAGPSAGTVSRRAGALYRPGRGLRHRRAGACRTSRSATSRPTSALTRTGRRWCWTATVRRPGLGLDAGQGARAGRWPTSMSTRPCRQTTRTPLAAWCWCGRRSPARPVHGRSGGTAPATTIEVGSLDGDAAHGAPAGGTRVSSGPGRSGGCGGRWRPTDAGRADRRRVVRIRGVDEGEARRASTSWWRTAFADHWGHHRREFDDWWQDTSTRYGFDLSLWWLAELDGAPAGVLVGTSQMAEEDAIFISWLGVLPARGRGVGKSLLRKAFAAGLERGWSQAQLGVDSDSPTSAPQLYSAVGMTRGLRHARLAARGAGDHRLGLGRAGCPWRRE